MRTLCCEYLDGELSSSEMRRLDAHFAECGMCRAELEQCRLAEGALSSALRFAPPAGDLRPGFYARLADAQTDRRRRSTWKLAAPAFAAALVGLVFLRLSLRPNPGDPRRPLAPDLAPPSLAAPVVADLSGSSAAPALTPRSSTASRMGVAVDGRIAVPPLRVAPVVNGVAPEPARPEKAYLYSAVNAVASAPRWRWPAPDSRPSVPVAPPVRVYTASVRVAMLLDRDMNGSELGMPGRVAVLALDPSALEGNPAPLDEQETHLSASALSGGAAGARVKEPQRQIALKYAPSVSWALADAPGSDYLVQKDVVMSKSLSASDEEVNLHVADDVRGFTTSTCVAGASATSGDTSLAVEVSGTAEAAEKPALPDVSGHDAPGR